MPVLKEPRICVWMEIDPRRETSMIILLNEIYIKMASGGL